MKDRQFEQFLEDLHSISFQLKDGTRYEGQQAAHFLRGFMSGFGTTIGKGEEENRTLRDAWVTIDGLSAKIEQWAAVFDQIPRQVEPMPNGGVLELQNKEFIDVREFGAESNVIDEPGDIMDCSNATTGERLGDSVETVLVPKGWKLVPLVPTKHMLNECEDAGSITNHARGHRIYNAFLGAVPNPPVPAVSLGSIIYLYRRKGLAGFASCDKGLFLECSRQSHLFETMIAYKSLDWPLIKSED